MFQWATTIKITGFVLCVFVCERRGCWSRFIENHAVSSGNLFVICYIVWYCTVFVSLPHNHNVISSMCISSLAVLNGWRMFTIFSMHTLKFVYEKLQHATSTYTNLNRTVLLYFFGKTLFSAKYSVCARNVVNVNM